MKVTTDGCLFGAWVAEQTAKLPRSSSRLMDIGTGTGLLSLMVAQQYAGIIDAIEIDPAAAEQAAENIAASPWKNRIEVICQDVLQWKTPARYDCIFSNPPFYEKEIKSTKNEKNVAHHDEGLKLTSLLTFIKNNLAADGTFFLLLPAKREKEIDSLLKSNGLFLTQKILVKQTPKHPPFRLMIQGCVNEVKADSEQMLTIKNESGHYTPAFVALLKDYYLYLSMAS